MASWHYWARKHRYGITLVTVTESIDGGALVQMYTKTEVYVDHWGSYEVAKGYFGPVKGFRGSRVLRGVHTKHVRKDGTVEYDNA